MSERSGLSYTERPRLPLVAELNTRIFPIGGGSKQKLYEQTESERERVSTKPISIGTVVKIKVIIMLHATRYVCKHPRANSTIYSNTWLYHHVNKTVVVRITRLSIDTFPISSQLWVTISWQFELLDLGLWTIIGVGLIRPPPWTLSPTTQT